MKDIAPVVTAYVQMVIDEVYPGSRWDHTCVAELEVWGMAKQQYSTPLAASADVSGEVIRS